MKHIKVLLITFLLSGLFFSGCSLDTEPDTGPETIFFNITDGFVDWIIPFDSVGQVISYKNSEDSISLVVVERTFDLDNRVYADCNVDNVPVQCELESINLAFPAEIHLDNFQPFVSIFAVGPNELRVMANRVGIDASIATFVDDPTETFTELEDNFSASFLADFVYEGVERSAIIIETTSLDGLVPGSFIPPLRMILVKGVGVVEWDDFNEITWTLEN